MSNLTTIFFVRHGETDANLYNKIQGQTDVPLNESGLKQAELIGKRLKDVHFDFIYSSDLSRAAVTAKNIAGEREVILTQELREWNLGAWQGKYLSDIAVEFAEEYNLFKTRSASFSPTDGESVKEFRIRAKKFMDYIVKTHPGKTVLCVSHGGFLRSVLANAMNLDCYPEARTDNTSISCFRTLNNGESWQLVSWNDTSHLDGNFVYTTVW